MLSECAWDLAYQVASEAFSALEVEVLSLSFVHGRVLSQPTYSLCDLPAFATSSMDGWVVRGLGPWKIVGEVFTGSLTDQVLGEFECMKIATGGVIPIGGQSVLPWEEAKEEAEYVRGQSQTGVNIRPAGIESKKGDLLFDAGTTLNPPKIGVLAATGHDEVTVARKPRIALFILGDELLHSGVPKDGSIRDSLGPQLPAFLEIYGAHVLSVQFIRDDLSLLISSIDSALPNVDMVITTGGTADGPRDYIKSAIARLGGDYLIDRVKVRPGYHVLLARISSQPGRQIPFLALPGNPQSALAALTSFGQPIINALLSKTKVSPSTIKLGEVLQTPPGFSRLVPGHLDEDWFRPSGYLGSAMLRGVAHATGFALISPGRHDVGASARWLPLPT